MGKHIQVVHAGPEALPAILQEQMQLTPDRIADRTSNPVGFGQHTSDAVEEQVQLMEITGYLAFIISFLLYTVMIAVLLSWMYLLA